MTQRTYEQLIMEGIRGLPDDLLSEIADFVYFVRRRTLDPKAFEEERREALIGEALLQLREDEARHLELEFEGYEQRYPRE
jgi:hypothetical protein